MSSRPTFSRRVLTHLGDATSGISNAMLAKKTKVSVLGHIAMAGIALSTVPLAECAKAWPALAFLMGLVATRLLLAQLYTRQNFSNELLFRQLYGSVTVLSGGAWSWFVISVFRVHGEIDHITVMPIVLVGAIAVAGTTSLSPDRHLGRLFVSILLLPIVVLLVGQWAHLGLPLAAVLFTSWLFLLAQIDSQARTIQGYRDREEKYRALTAATQEVVMIHEMGRILEVNKAAEQIFGCPTDELIGSALLDHVAPEEREAPADLIERGHNKTLQVRFMKKDGSVFTAEIYSRFFEFKGHTTKITCLRNVEERIQAERVIRESAQQIEAVAKEREQTAVETARMKSEFLANMSHEIRTPLNAIIGVTDLMSDLVTTPQQKRYLRTLGDSSESLLTLVNDILDFSKIDADKMEFEKIHFSLANLLESQSDLLATRAQQKGLSIVTGVDPELPSLVQGDSGRLGQVLLNLIGNAIKFTDRGYINVRCSLVEKAGSAVKVRCEVQDTGAGLSEEAISRLFTPFTQADSSTSRKHGGTGLGLSICKKIIEKMGGQIGVVSKEKVGSTFWFELPLEVVETETLSSRYTRTEWTAKHVYIVADANSSAQTLADYLRAWGVNATVGSAERLVVGPAISTKAHVDLIIATASHLRKSLDVRFVQPFIQILDEGAMASEISGAAASLSVPIRQSDLYNALLAQFAPQISEQPSKPVATATANIRDVKINARVLVAEDNSTNQMLVLAQLRKLGITAQAVTNGAEAIDALIRTKFDLVLMDCQMPGVDGFEATQKIREMEQSSGLHIPIIALTANAFEEDKRRCLEVGMDAYLSKPLRREQLVGLLKQYLMPAA